MSCGVLPGFSRIRRFFVTRTSRSPVAGGLDRPFGPSQIACSGAAPIPHPCVEAVQAIQHGISPPPHSRLQGLSAEG